MTTEITTLTIISHSIKYAELIAAIFGVVFYYKFKHTPLKYFLYILWYITISEFFAGFIWSHKIDFFLYNDNKGLAYNFWIYNLLYFVFFNVVFYIYYNYIKTAKYRLLILTFIIGYIIISIINWSFLQNFGSETSVLPYILGSFFLIICVIFYFIELLKSDKIVQFHKLLLFWISVGLLLYHAGTIPFTIKSNSYIHMPNIDNLYYINHILAIVMYLIFIFGFVWSKKE